MEETAEKKKIIVSDEFVEVYKYLAADDMTERINALPEMEKYLLVLLALDKHDVHHPVVHPNVYPLRGIGEALYDQLSEHEHCDDVVSQLVEMTGDKYLDVSVLRDGAGNEMPEPATKDEIRDYKLRFLDNVD